MYSSCGVSPTGCGQSRTSGGGAGFTNPARRLLTSARQLAALHLCLPSSCSSLRSSAFPFSPGCRARYVNLLQE